MRLRIPFISFFRPGAHSGAANRSRERYRRAALSGITSALSRVVSLGASLLTVRLAYRYLGGERYGMWMTISSFVLMLGFADFGISNGLINLVADALGRENRVAAKQAISSAFWMLICIAAVFGICFMGLYPFVDAPRLFNVHTVTAVHEAGPSLLILTLCFVFNLPLGTVRGAQIGMQNAVSNNLWAVAGSILSVGALVVAIRAKAGLPILVLSLSAPPVLMVLLNGVALFSAERDLTPRLSVVQRDSVVRMLRVGGMYFVLQLAISIGMQTDNLVIAQIMGATAVADFAVPGRLFNMVNVVLVMVSAAMWPAYADAVARKDGRWIRTSFLRVSAAGMICTILATLILLFFANRIITAWVGPQLVASHLLLIAFGVQCIVYAYLQPIGFLLSGVSQFRVQAICAGSMAILNLGLSILLVKHLGIAGAVLGTVIAQLIVQVVPLTITTRRVLRNLSGPIHEPQLASDAATIPS